MRSKYFIVPSLGFGIVMTLMLLAGCGGGNGGSDGGVALVLSLIQETLPRLRHFPILL